MSPQNTIPQPERCAQAAALLERILRAQHQAHERLLACIERQHEGIRRADVSIIVATCAEAQPFARNVSELDRACRRALADLTQMFQPDAQHALRLSELAGHLGDSHANRLNPLAAALRTLIERVQRQSAIAHTAGERLNRHLAGIVQTMHQALDRARIYGVRGRIALNSHLHSTFDLKS